MYLRTLGELAIEGRDLTRPKPLLLLAYLALEGPRERRYLSDLFWPGAKSGRHSLSVALSQIRKDAPAAVRTAGPRIETPIETDVADLRRALLRGDLENARELYRGPFLAGLDLDLGVDEQLVAWSLHLRGLAAVERGAVDEGLADLGRSVVKFRRVGNRVAVAGALTSRGRGHRAAGQLPASARDLERALALARGAEVRWYEARALLELSETLAERGDPERAAERRREAERIRGELHAAAAPSP